MVFKWTDILVIPALVVFFTKVLLWLLKCFKPIWNIYKKAQLLPGPPAWPLVGNLFLLSADGVMMFRNLVNLAKTYGDVVRLWFGPVLFVNLMHPEDIKAVLRNTQFQNRDPVMNKPGEFIFGQGLLSARDKHWSTHRRLITPNFHFNILQTYVQKFGDSAQAMCDELEVVADGRSFDIRHFTSVSAMRSICYTVIGCDESHPIPEYVVKCMHSSTDRAAELILERFAKPWKLVDWIYKMSEDGKESYKIKGVIESMLDSMIAQTLSAVRSKNDQKLLNNIDEEVNEKKKVKTLLELLLTSSSEGGDNFLSHQEIKEELTTMIAVGFHTTSTTLSNVCLFLAMHPHLQDEISRELDEIFGGDTRQATVDDINRMHIIGGVIKESLRLLPSVIFVTRDISEDFKLPSGHTLPSGCFVSIFLYSLHHDARYFPDPDSFLPHRWLDTDACAARHPYAYLPFGAGSRNCIGQKYAMLQMKSVISALLRKFTITTQCTMEDLKNIELTISLAPVKKYQIQMRKKVIT